jgi:hypothetical protein
MSCPPLVIEELIARQSPEAQSIIRLLLARIAELEARLHQSPRNSSRPPSTEHPHAKPTPRRQVSGAGRERREQNLSRSLARRANRQLPRTRDSAGHTLTRQSSPSKSPP